MKTSFLLDSSGILRTSFDYSAGGYAVTPLVLGELRSQPARTAVEEAVKAGRIMVLAPGEKGLALAYEAATQTGDIRSLSPADLELIATAAEHGLQIITDDYAVQNTAAKLGLKAMPTTHDGIRKQIRWVWTCVGCGRKMDGPGTCSVCGHKGRRKPT